MTDTRSLVRSLLAVPELTLRRDSLRSRLTCGSACEAALALEGLCQAVERADPAAREAFVAASVLLIQEGQGAWIDTLRHAARDHGCQSLQRILRSFSPESATAPDVASGAVPDYGGGRELTVGERRALARRPNRRHIDRLLCDPHPLVIRQLLENPHLVEADVVRLAIRRPLPHAVSSTLGGFPDWLVRDRIRRALVSNPTCPSYLVMPLLPLMTRTELVEVVHSSALHAIVRLTARELVDLRPPLAGSGSPALQ